MTTKFRSVFWAFPRRLASDTRGATLALVAASITALIGFTGLGVETGLWYAMKRQNQSAADVAALSGAFELLAGQSNGLSQNTVYPDICNLAERDAARNDFTFNSFTCPTTTPACTSPPTGQMCANNPPVLGISAGNNNAVEVILSQQQNALFANLFLAQRYNRNAGCCGYQDPGHVLRPRLELYRYRYQSRRLCRRLSWTR